MADTRWLTVADICERLQVHEETVRRWIRSGDLPATALGRKAGYRIKESDFIAFLEKRNAAQVN
jgi:excisionase family DNA binding protein